MTDSPARDYDLGADVPNVPEMDAPLSTLSLDNLSRFLAQNGLPNEVVGDRALEIVSVNTLERAAPGEISFLSNPKYTNHLATTRASAVIVDRNAAIPRSMSAIRCDDPYAGVTAAIIRIHGHREHPAWGVDPSAVVSPTAVIGDGANIGPHVVIRDDVAIGKNVAIYPGCFIGDHAQLGDDVTLFPNVTVYHRVRIGSRVTIHAGSSIGQDGLGYAPKNGRWIKIPQIGDVVIEDDVEIGACCAIDRATLGETRIGKGTKFSNGVVIGHGTRLGEHCMIVGQVGVAGTVTIGNRVTLAGQVGVSGHLTIEDDVRVGAQSGVNATLKSGGEYMGSPAVDAARFRRQIAVVHKLPNMIERLRELERQVEALQRTVKPDDDQPDAQ